MTGNGRANFRCAALTLAAVLLCAPPAQASSLAASSVNAGGAGNAVKKNLEELTEIFGEMVDATITGEDAKVRKLWQEVKKSPGRIAKEAFPVFKVGAGAAERLKSAANKIERFAGRVGEAAADGRAAAAEGMKSAGRNIGRIAADPRAALAVGEKERPLYESKTGIFGGGPLPKAKGASNAAAAAVKPSGADPWASAGIALDEVQKFGRCHEGRAYRRGTDKYNFYRGLLESQRNAPWRPCMPGKPKVKKPDKAKKKETAKARDGDGGAQREYEAALVRILGKDSVSGGSGDYNSALTGLEAKEAARRKEEARRLAAAKERKRKAEARRLAAAKERKRKARLAKERRLAAQRAYEREREADMRENRRLDALEREQQRQGIRNVARSLQNFVNQAAGVYGGGQPNRQQRGRQPDCIEDLHWCDSGDSSCEAKNRAIRAKSACR